MASRQSYGEVKKLFKSFTIAATGRWSVAMPSYLIILPFGIATSLQQESWRSPLVFTNQVFLIVIAGYFGSFLYLFAMQATVLKNRKNRPDPLWKCLLVWYSTGSLQGLLSAFYANRAFHLDWNLGERVSFPTIYTGTSLALFAYYFGTIERLRVEAEALKGLEGILELDRDLIRTSETTIQFEIRNILSDDIKPQIEKLQTKLLLLNNDLDKTSLSSIYSNLIAKSSNIDSSLTSLSKSVSRIPQLRYRSENYSILTAALPRRISVRISFVLITLGVLAVQLPINGWEGVVAEEIAAVLITMTLLLISRFLKSSRIQGEEHFIVIGYFLVFIIEMGWMAVQSSFGYQLNNEVNPLYSGLLTLYAVYVASVTSNLITKNAERLNHSFQENLKLLDEISTRLTNEDDLKRSVFKTRFGALQGKLSGVTMAIQLFVTSSDESQINLDYQVLQESAGALLTEALAEISELVAFYEK